MTRLIDRFGARSARALPVDEFTWPSVLAQTYAARDLEPIQSTFLSYSTEGYQGNGIVFAVILARLNLFAEAQFKWRRESDKALFGTPELDVFKTPWPGGTTGDLLARMEQDASLAGQSFIRRGAWLHRMRPDLVDRVLTSGPSPEIAGYAYWPEGRGVGPAEFYTPDEVADWSPIPDPMSQFRGMSWLTPVAREINADRSMSEYKGAFFTNNATPNALIKYEQKLGPGAVEQIQARWSQRYGGPNGWKTAVLDQGADFTVIGQSMEQIQFADVQAAGENRIAAAAGVPAIVVGLKEGLDASTYANYAAAMRRFADMTMRPNWRSACAALSRLVDVPAGARLWYDTTDIAAIREAERDRAEAMQVWAAAASTLLTAGYTAESVTAALTASDLTLLQHTGMLSVQLQPPGVNPETSGGTDAV